MLKTRCSLALPFLAALSACDTSTPAPPTCSTPDFGDFDAELYSACLPLTSSTHDYTPVETCAPHGGLSYRAPERSNVMLTIDRSSSMTSHWPSLMQLTPMVDQLGATSNLGAAFFPDQNGDCNVSDAIEVQIGPDQGASVLQALAETSPYGATPMASVIHHVRQYAALQDPYRENVLVVVADGEPSCDDTVADVVQAVECFSFLQQPVTMHFVSFADSHSARTTMQQAAAAAEDGVFHEATNVSELYEILARVGATLDACSYVLDQPVDDVDVQIDGESLPVCTGTDCLEGFTYEAATGIVSLAPVSCRAAASQTCPDVQIHAR